MKKLFILATAAVALASCSDSDLVGNIASSQQTEQPQAVEFGTYMGSQATRAEAAIADKKGVITTNGLNSTKALSAVEYGVFGYHSGTTAFGTWCSWNPGTTQANVMPNFMYNQEIEWNTTLNAWTYSPVKYWPNGVDAANATANPSYTATEADAQQKLSFFAYAPYTSVTTTAYDTSDGAYPSGISDAVKTRDAASEYGIVAMSKNTAKTDMWVKYKMNSANANDVVDLLWAIRGQFVYNETDGSDNDISTDGLGNKYNVDLTKQTVPEKVNFLFKHALAKVGGSVKKDGTSTDPAQSGIKVVLDVDDNSTNSLVGGDNQSQYLNTNFNNEITLVTIKDVKIRDKKTYGTETSQSLTSDLATEGWFDIMAGKWAGVATNGDGTIYKQKVNQTGTVESTDLYKDNVYELNADIKEPTKVTNSSISANKWSISGTTGVTTGTPKPLYSNVNAPSLLLIPGGADATSNTLYVTVTYVVRTIDNNLAWDASDSDEERKGLKFTEVEQTITNEVHLGNNLDPNKYYTLIMHLGLTSVKFEAVVADWVNDDGTTFNEDGTPISGTTENGKSVWLPSNVVKNVTSLSIAKGQNQTVNVAANTESFAITVTGLANGNTIEVAKSGNATSASASPTTVTAAGSTVVTVALPSNSTGDEAKSSSITITEKNGSEVVSKTIVNIVQARGTYEP